MSGNPGMKTPSEQGFSAGIMGEVYNNPYTERGEELERDAFRTGFFSGYAKFSKLQDQMEQESRGE
jgi:hypothetical protein